MRRFWSALVTAGTALSVLTTLHTLVNVRLLRRLPAAPRLAAERVSVLLPARDEAHRITPAIRSLLAQQGVPDLEILVLDDCSADGTADLVRRVVAGDARVRVLTGSPPADGLPGKPHACAQLAAVATGSVLVLVDADVVLEPHAVAAAVQVLREHDLHALSPFPRQLADGWAPRLVQPLLQWSWLAVLPLRIAERSPRPSLSAANGQFLVLDADVLGRSGGFEAVRAAVLDDIAVVRSVKVAGGRAAVTDGSGAAACRMYEDWPQLRAGYRKSLWSVGANPVALGAVLVVTFVLPPLAALGGSRSGLLGFLAAVLGRVVAGRSTGARVWPDAVAHPVSVGVLVFLLFDSRRARRTGVLTWKDRPLHGSR